MVNSWIFFPFFKTKLSYPFWAISLDFNGQEPSWVSLPPGHPRPTEQPSPQQHHPAQSWRMGTVLGTVSKAATAHPLGCGYWSLGALTVTVQSQAHSATRTVVLSYGTIQRGTEERWQVSASLSYTRRAWYIHHLENQPDTRMLMGGRKRERGSAFWMGVLLASPGVEAGCTRHHQHPHS